MNGAFGSVDMSVESACSTTMDVAVMNSPNEVSMKSITSPTESVQELTSVSPSECDETEGCSSALEQALEACVSKDVQEKVSRILDEVQQLSDTEKLLLYLRLPGETLSDASETTEQGQALPISTTRAEQTQAFHWIRCHLEECDNSSTLPKHEVYDEYKAYCESMNAARTLSAPDFGKIIKCVFPRVKARRLGTRGNSKYCYSGIQRKMNVKPPSLPSLQIPSASDKEKAVVHQSSLSGSDKIEEDQTLSAACLLVCEWANKLLGRVFTTLIELARFLVGGSYVSSKSMAAFVVMSSNDSGTQQLSHCTLMPFVQVKQGDGDQLIVTQKRRQTHQQLQKKIQQRQQQKQQNNGHPVLPQTPAAMVTQSHAVMPHSQAKTQVSLQQVQQSPLHKQPFHIQPKPLHSPLQSPPPQVGGFYQQHSGHPSTPNNGYKVRPLTPSLRSPTSQQQSVPQTPSPFQSSPKFNAPSTHHNRPVTPSSAGSTTPRHTPNSSETTRFLFTPITNASQNQPEHRINRDASPPTLRPMATHPNQLVNGDWIPAATQQLPNTNDVPVSPSKQPRLIGQATPTTPTRRPSSFPYPISSPRTPQRMNQGTFVTSPPILSPPGCGRAAVSPSVAHSKSQGFVSPLRLVQQDAMHAQPPPPLQSPFAQDSIQEFMHPTIKDGSGLSVIKACRYGNSGSDASPLPARLLHQRSLDCSPELESLGSQAQGGMPPPPYQRSQSVPPLPLHMIADKRFHPLTPQTDTRPQHVTPTSHENTSQRLNGLKELRSRVLHGDVNNNGSRVNHDSSFSARRNLTSLLNAEQSSVNNQWPGGGMQGSAMPNGAQTQPVTAGHSEDQDMVMIDSNLNFSDLGNDSDESGIPDLNTLDEATTEAVLRNICNNTSGMWPTSDTWPVATQSLEIMD